MFDLPRILSMPPGAVLGYRRNGQPIYPIAGGSGEGGEGGEAPAGTEGAPSAETAPGAGTQPAAPAPEAPAAPAAAGDGDGGSGQDDAAKTARTIAAIREDFKAERSKRQEAEKRLTEIQSALEADKAERTKQMDALAIALGIKPSEEPPDPAKLAADLKAAQEQAQAALAQRDTTLRQQAVELAVLRNASQHGANGDALLDSRSFMSKVSSLDPAAGDFAEQLGAAIKATVETGPQYKAATPAPEPKPAPQPARSGGEFNGAPGGNRQWTLADVQAASPAELVAAQDAGLLIDLGYAPRKKAR